MCFHSFLAHLHLLITVYDTTFAQILWINIKILSNISFTLFFNDTKLAYWFSPLRNCPECDNFQLIFKPIYYIVYS